MCQFSSEALKTQDDNAILYHHYLYISSLKKTYLLSNQVCYDILSVYINDNQSVDGNGGILAKLLSNKHDSINQLFIQEV